MTIYLSNCIQSSDDDGLLEKPGTPEKNNTVLMLLYVLIIRKIERRKKGKQNQKNRNFFKTFEVTQTHTETYTMQTVPYEGRFIKCCETEYFNRHQLDITTAIQKKISITPVNYFQAMAAVYLIFTARARVIQRLTCVLQLLILMLSVVKERGDVEKKKK